MSSLEHFIITGVTLFFPPILCLCLLVIVLATFGKSLGLRKAYVQFLLQVFEWASHNVKIAQRKEEKLDEDGESSLQDGQVAESAVTYSPKNLRERRGSGVIKREAIKMFKKVSIDMPTGSQVETVVSDSFDFIKAGVEAIIEDEVTSRFEAEELMTWNLLSRTSFNYHYVNWKITLLWFFGTLIRYSLLLPGRLFLMIIGLSTLVICTTFIGYLPEGRLKIWLYERASLMCFRVLARATSSIVTYHNLENMARPGGICVANHTSPFDVIVLSCDNCYALVGQKQGGLLGVMQRALNRATSHIFFERAEANDRAAVSRRLREHVEDLSKLPILIFPEGTCINNTSVMMFKKGSFEVGGVIYPVAIKYDSRFGDPFWNSSKQGHVEYLLMMMTSWAIVADVWYLPPMARYEAEDGVTFANRVKRKIAESGGLVDLAWDGQLKRYPVKESMLEHQRKRYSKRVQMAPYLSSHDQTNSSDGDSLDVTTGESNWD